MIEWLLFLFYSLDIFFTYLNTRKLKALNPKGDCFSHELNPVVRFFWRKFGLTKGTIIAYLVLMPIILFVVFNTKNDHNILWFFFGAYTIIFMTHLGLWGYLKRVTKKINE